jgi:YjbE family integral membrane protein
MLAFVEEPNWLLQLGSIVLVDLLLAGDNAIVIAMAVRILPEKEQRLGRLWGTFGAVALRVLFLALASWLIAIPYLRAAGGVLLLWIAYKLLAPQPHGPVEGGGEADSVRAGRNLRDAIRVIILADVSMSIDNVLAVTGLAEGHLGMAALGIALSIPMVIWGSALLSKIMQNHKWIVWLGGGILGHVSGVLILEEPQFVDWFGHPAKPGWHPMPLALFAGFTAFGAFGHWRSKRGASEAAH